jgi:aspartate racemase
MQSKTIGIVGGMGPRAGIDLADKIIKNTVADSDQQHIPLLLISYPHQIGDRTEFLQGKIPENPAYAIYQLICQLESWGADIIGIPCSTAHLTPIMNVIKQLLTDHQSGVVLVNMLEAVAQFFVLHFCSLRNVGLLATLGTYQNATYQATFAQFGLKMIIPNHFYQQAVHSAIYHPQYGIKSTLSPNLEQAKSELHNACNHLIDLGAEAIVLGCTEIPLVLTEQYHNNTPLIDPTDILARKLIELADCHKLKPYL